MTTPQDPPAVRKKRARARKKLAKWRAAKDAEATKTPAPAKKKA